MRQPDDWFGLTYGFNIYRGCQHQCIYCDSRSECYRIDNFNDVLVKVNAPDLLRSELKRKRLKGTIGTGSMSDPYTFVERDYRLTRRALEVIAEAGFPLHLLTKSELVTRDADVLVEIQRKTMAVAAFTLTTTDDDLAGKIEPGAAPPSRRLKALEQLSKQGIRTGVALMPVLPYLEDNVENLMTIARRAKDAGAEYLLPAVGMTLRDRQRLYFYERLDELFPDLRAHYEKTFGERYDVRPANWKELDKVLREECLRLGLAVQTPRWQPPRVEQMSLL
jgi:DNA repair photolyase